MCASLLRLEELFRRLTHFSDADGADEHHVALQTLFDMAWLGARGDLKSELIQDLERQRFALRCAIIPPSPNTRWTKYWVRSNRP